MSVFVDDMKAQYGWMVMCHMGADTTEELNESESLVAGFKMPERGMNIMTSACRSVRSLSVMGRFKLPDASSCSERNQSYELHNSSSAARIKRGVEGTTQK